MVMHSLTLPHLISSFLVLVPKGFLLEVSISRAKWRITLSLSALRN